MSAPFFPLFFQYVLVKFGELDGDFVLDFNAADWDLDFVWFIFFFSPKTAFCKG